ncbi:n-(5'-phosphoribosyl)anthranilate isomerase [Firmicutes bacterium CAG:646]|nr:phosphoribosylanthranilate isomerase [Bacillota bacterium]CCZ34246.1 n-(5'-phosphoribosyl)anthranilate isomerase [Firmicutes bacterium CAG:646]
MTRIKFCGVSCMSDVEAVNELMPEYIGFVFVKTSKRYLSPERAEKLKKHLNPDITAVGVFADEDIKRIAELCDRELIDMVQLHGKENEKEIQSLRAHIVQPIIKAFCVKTMEDIRKAKRSSADYILLDSGAGTGIVFDWKLIKEIGRPYFLAGGIQSENVGDAVKQLNPYAVDVSSGIETGGRKDKKKMQALIAAVRKEERL